MLLFLSRQRPGVVAAADEEVTSQTLKTACQAQAAGADPGSVDGPPLRNLVGFTRVGPLKPGQAGTARFQVSLEDLAAFRPSPYGSRLPLCGRHWLRVEEAAVAVVLKAPS